MIVRLVLFVLISLAASGCGERERTSSGADAASLMQEIADGDESWQTIVDAARDAANKAAATVRSEGDEALETIRSEGEKNRSSAVDSVLDTFLAE